MRRATRAGVLVLLSLDAGCTSTPTLGQTAPCDGLTTQTTVIERTAATEVRIDGGVHPLRGIFDPSLVYPPDAGSGAMTYSAVQATADITTRIAVSIDRGSSWNDVGAVNTTVAESIPVPPTSTRCPGGTCTGTLIHEVSTLVDDPGDPDASRRFKVFDHSYLVLSTGELARDLGYLGLYTAPSPSGPWTDEGKALGWLGESTFSSSGAHTLVSSVPALADCVALTEPGGLLRSDGSLDLAVGCAAVTGGQVVLRIELLRSTDHARTFTHVARLLGGTDGSLNAADLFVAGGHTYLSVTPDGPTSLGFEGYRGCRILVLTPAGDAVERTDAGAPVVCRTLDGPDQPFAGACTYAAGATAAGYLLPQLGADSGGTFRIFASGVLAP